MVSLPMVNVPIPCHFVSMYKTCRYTQLGTLGFSKDSNTTCMTCAMHGQHTYTTASFIILVNYVQVRLIMNPSKKQKILDPCKESDTPQKRVRDLEISGF